MKNNASKAKLVVRNATLTDLKEIQILSEKVYPDIPPYSVDVLRGQLNNYPEGQFVAVYDQKIVGYCATIRVSEQSAMSAHTWRQITGSGYGSTHLATGEYLYGMEIFVDPDYRGLRIGERLYSERKKLCSYYRLKGIVFGGRMPLLKKKLKQVGTVENYVEQVKNRSLNDPTTSFQLRQGFEVIGLLKDYLPSDKESMGAATHMVWRNPEAPEPEGKSRENVGRLPESVRVATVQYEQRRIHSFEEFEQIVTYFVDVVSDYRSDFVVFPELFTLQLLSIENEPIAPDKSIDRLTEYTERIKEMFTRLAIKYNINIIAGSHPTKMKDGSIQNVTFVCLRDGAVHEQPKIHPTPNERYWWNIEGGNELSVIQTDCGPIGVLICYDCEFPELARHLIDQGANILFVPFCTDERQGYLRVRYSAQARAVENQCYVVMSGNVGNLPRVHNMDIQYAQSCILTPCDFYFSRDGIAADTTPNVETVAFADLRLEYIYRARHSGTVMNLKDRRHDLYSVVWHKKNVLKPADEPVKPE
ncbi:GNAT family N-acetyltransferase [Vampirovibrio sp.]|uniref:GNAT family N-acetyltransferase n=1 Tax=Vampirovibrio sp. TaxID=2717857 RepID=UPI003592FE00